MTYILLRTRTAKRRFSNRIYSFNWIGRIKRQRYAFQLKSYMYLSASIEMMRVIRICNNCDKMQSFTDKLEDKARKVLASPDRKNNYFSLSSLIKNDLALTLNQINKLRTRGKDIFQSLLQSECYVETELMQMDDRTPKYSPYRFSERTKLQSRLGRIAEERRRFTLTHAEKFDSLHDRLLSLLKKHRQLSRVGD